MVDRLAGKVAVISGGATGMGGAASRLFAAEGARVAIVDRNMAAAAALLAGVGGKKALAPVGSADKTLCLASYALVTPGPLPCGARCWAIYESSGTLWVSHTLPPMTEP